MGHSEVSAASIESLGYSSTVVGAGLGIYDHG